MTKQFLYNRAIEIYEREFGADHPNHAYDLINVASLLHTQDRIDEANALRRRPLEINKRAQRSDHLNVALELSSIAALVNEKESLLTYL